MNASDNIYWVFSAASQTVAAFVAFLLAGYALVLNMMESAVEADDSLFEINEELKRRYHLQLSGLTIVTAAAIVSSLLVVYLNAIRPAYFSLLISLAAVLVLASVAGGVWFVIRVVDPGKYRKAAVKLSEEIAPPLPTAARRSSAEFFTSFVNLERVLRQVWQRRAQGERLSRRQGAPSFREMVESLYRAELLPPTLYERLHKVGRYRNLVFHGHISDVEPEILEEIKAVRAELQPLQNEV